jgi:hypothetical protein
MTNLIKAPHFNEQVAKLAAAFPQLTHVTPQQYAGTDGKTYYYVTFQLQGAALPSQTHPNLSPLGAYRAALQTLRREASNPRPAPIVPAAPTDPAPAIYGRFPDSTGQLAVHVLVEDWQTIADNAKLTLKLKDGHFLNGLFIRSGLTERNAFYLEQPTDVAFALAENVASVWEKTGWPVVARRF